jgi:membrane associated rhomboid family serine protease
MLTLYFFAGYIIDNVGRINFLIIYFGSLLAGNLITYYFHKNQPHYTAIGASGAVMGILYSAILINPHITLGLFGIIPVPGFVFAIGYLLYSIYGMKNNVGNIGHTAHLGGAIAGYLLTILLHSQVLQTSRMMVIVLAIPIILIIIFKDKLKF